MTNEKNEELNEELGITPRSCLPNIAVIVAFVVMFVLNLSGLGYEGEGISPLQGIAVIIAMSMAGLYTGEHLGKLIQNRKWNKSVVSNLSKAQDEAPIPPEPFAPPHPRPKAPNRLKVKEKVGDKYDDYSAVKAERKAERESGKNG